MLGIKLIRLEGGIKKIEIKWDKCYNFLMIPILHQSLWRDEALSFFIAEKPLNEIFLFVIKDVQAPFYYFILHYWMILFGSSEAIIRSLSVIFHLLLGILIFFFVRHLTKNTIASIFASLAILFNPFLLSYSFEARPYSLLAFLITLALYLFMTKRFLFASIILSLSIFTHNFALFSLLGLFSYWIIRNGIAFVKRERETIRESLLLFFIPVVSILFWGGFVLNQWRKVTESFWINPTTSDMFLQTFENFFGGPINYEGRGFLLTVVFILSGFVIASWVVNEKKEKLEATAFLLVSVAPIVIAYLISSLWVSNFHERYVIASVPLLILLAAVSLHRLQALRGDTLSYVLVSILVVYLVSSIQAAEKIVRLTTKPSINYAVNEILTKAREGDIIIPEEYLNFLETKYYVKRSGSSIPVYALSSSGKIVWYANATAIDSAEIIRELPKDKRVWQIKPDGGYQLLDY